MPRSSTKRTQQPDEQVEKADLGPGMAQRLRDARDTRGWTLRKLRDVSGVSTGAIQAIENGGKGKVSCATVWQLATALKVSPGWLAFGELLVIRSGKTTQTQ